ncbi:MAG: major facilitator superfamily protein [Candidatus Berkelbacteria bacterium Athens1014_28]|uniref:Major facilitator superfamily protein n=1 Tax=Candidatus Berkelbacteria bacterium Athens1014_28 TaxID=2017145 RepID=A0A554LJV7_9BACT|nr:MAG: major facilitator superfamily protein [Candidatus Berkelbacteria bacterium Athens1014_28]
MRNTFYSVLKNRDFFRLWVAQILSQVAGFMLTFALILHIYYSTTTVSLVMLATALPSVIFGPFSGVLSDKIQCKKVLIWTNFLRFLVALVLLISKENTLAILEIVFLMSTITQFFSPAELSSIPLIIKKENLVQANSVYITSQYAALILGYGIAGPLQALVGSDILFIIIALMFLLSAFSISLMSNYDKKENHRILIFKIAKSIVSVWRATKEGLSYIWQNQKIFSPTIKLVVGWAVLGSFIVVLPAFSESTLGISARFAGALLIVPAGAGMLIASFLLNKFHNWKKEKVMTVGFILCGFSLLALSFYHFYQFFSFSLILAILLMVIMGGTVGLVYISAQTLQHLNSDENMRGRIFGIAAMLINLAMSLPAILVGGIADLTSPVFTLILIALFIIVYSFYLVFADEFTGSDAYGRENN